MTTNRASKVLQTKSPYPIVAMVTTTYQTQFPKEPRLILEELKLAYYFSKNKISEEKKRMEKIAEKIMK